jgi:hypothetical protein
MAQMDAFRVHNQDNGKSAAQEFAKVPTPSP